MFARLVAVALVVLGQPTDAQTYATATLYVHATVVPTGSIELAGEWAQATGPDDAATGVVIDDEWVAIPPDAWTYVGDGGHDALAHRR